MKLTKKHLLAATSSLLLLCSAANANDDDFLLGLGAVAIIADEVVGGPYDDEIYVEEVYVEDPFYADEVYVEEVYVEDVFVDDVFVDDIYIEEIYVDDSGNRTQRDLERQKRREGQAANKSKGFKPEASRQVRDLQVRLNALGYAAGKPDGIAGKNTRAAIEAFQRSLGHTATGRLSNQEVAELVSQTKSKVGATSGKSIERVAASKKTERKTAQNAVPKKKHMQPTIYGVTVNQSVEAARKSLTEAGFSNCSYASGIMTCSKEAKTLTDEITLGVIEGKLYAVQRSVQFKDVVARNELEGRLAAAYPSLVLKGDMTRVSDEKCLASYQGSSAVLVSTVLNTPLQPQDLVAASHDCAFAYGIEIDEKDPVSTLNVALYSAQPIRSALKNKSEVFAATSPNTQDLKF